MLVAFGHELDHIEGVAVSTVSRHTVLRGAGGLPIIGLRSPSFLAAAAAAASNLTPAELDERRLPWVDLQSHQAPAVVSVAFRNWTNTAAWLMS